VSALLSLRAGLNSTAVRYRLFASPDVASPKVQVASLPCRTVAARPSEAATTPHRATAVVRRAHVNALLARKNRLICARVVACKRDGYELLGAPILSHTRSTLIA
jgi:hypothetical protein